MNTLNTSFLKTIFTLILCFVLNSLLLSQANTIVMGKARNVDLVKFIELEVNHRYIDNKADVHYSNILEDGTFAFAIEVTEPQLATLFYSRNAGTVYLEPNDTLYVDFDAGTFQHSFSFSGAGGKNNTYLNNYLKKHPIEKDVFKYLQYRADSYWYKIEPKEDKLMRTLTKYDYSQKVDVRKEQALSNLSFYEKNHTNELSVDFVEFMQTEILYHWAYHKMLFGDVYKGMHNLDETFFEFTKDVPIQNDQLGSHWYRMYITAFLNHQYMIQPEKADNPCNGQYTLSETMFSGKPQAYIQSELIAQGFSNKYIDETLPNYVDFIENNAYTQFDPKIVMAFQKAMKMATGTPAPEFVIKGANDSDLTLADLRGKVVFLNFWASWCRPCMKEMTSLKPVQEELEKEDIVFLHVSFDRNGETWKNTIESKELTGIHALVSGGEKSDIAKDYDVRAIPQYYIIDKNGTFAEKPLIFSEKSLKETLRRLNK